MKVFPEMTDMQGGGAEAGKSTQNRLGVKELACAAPSFLSRGVPTRPLDPPASSSSLG